MKNATTATDCSNDSSAARGRARSSVEVNRWVAMIDAELRSDDDNSQITEESVSVTLEFGRCTIDLASQPLQPGSSLKLDQLADEPLDVVVDGRPIARGELVEVDGRLGVRIVELLLLAIVWFACGVSPSLADERPLTHSFDEQPEVFKTPFGTARGSRATLESDDSLETAVEEPSHAATTPLPRRSDAATRTNAHNATGWSATVWPLLIVVGLIVVGARWLKSKAPTTARGLPNEVFEVLGRKAIDPRTSIVLARCGSRLLVLSLSPHGLNTLSEITDPVEIDCLAGLCHATPRDQSLVETFRSLLHKRPAAKPLDQRFVARQTSLTSEVHP